MKKIIATVLVVVMLIANAVNVLASENYTVEYLGDNYFLRSDATLYYKDGDSFTFVAINSLDEDMSNYDFVGKEEVGDYVVYHEYTEEEKPKLTKQIRKYTYLADDGKVYELRDNDTLECLGYVGIIKEFQSDDGVTCILSQDNTLYRADHWSLKKIASDVKDYKFSGEALYYRTNNNDLYSGDWYDSEFLLSDCSQLYSFRWGTVFAKTNSGKWYHMGDNRDFQLEPQKMVDGNNTTPESFETMIEATQYIYQWGNYEWNIDGNLYSCLDGTRNLIAENIIYMQEKCAITSDGDMIFDGDFIDMNIKNPEKYGFIGTEGEAYINIDNNLSFVDRKSEEEYYKRVLKIFKISEKYPDRSDWAADELSQADEIGYIDSVKFIPMQSNIKREDFCNMIVDFCEKYLGKEISSTSNPFKDTENEKVIKAYANGIIAGVSGNEFAPNDKITREQMCAIMTRAAKFLKPDVQFGQGIAFSDMDIVSDWAVEGVNAMSGLGIVKGDGVSITPKSNTSVEQAIAMTYRLYNKIR